MLSLHAPSLAATHAIAAEVAGRCRRGDVIVLAGEMGAGKTAWVQGFCAALGVSEPVTSPTFTLVHRYDGARLPVYHADVYRLSTLHEVDDLALAEVAEDGVLLVEWGDVVEQLFGDHLLLRLVHDDDDDEARRIEMVGHGPSWAARWSLLTESLEGFRC